MAARSCYAPPFPQGAQRIRDMLETMRGKNKIVGMICNAFERDRVTNPLRARVTFRIEANFSLVPQILLPCGPGGKIHVVDPRHRWVDRQYITRLENGAWPADFKTVSARRDLEHFRFHCQSRR